MPIRIFGASGRAQGMLGEMPIRADRSDGRLPIGHPQDCRDGRFTEGICRLRTGFCCGIPHSNISNPEPIEYRVRVFCGIMYSFPLPDSGIGGPGHWIIALPGNRASQIPMDSPAASSPVQSRISVRSDFVYAGYRNSALHFSAFGYAKRGGDRMAPPRFRQNAYGITFSVGYFSRTPRPLPGRRS